MMDIHPGTSDFRNWTYYKVEFKIYLKEDTNEVYRTDTFWTPYDFIESDIEHRMEDFNRPYWYSWKIIEEHKGIPEGYHYMIMH